MQCPRCGLVSSSKGNRCECGWDFSSNSWKETYPGESNLEALASAAIRRLDATIQCPHCEKVLPSFCHSCAFCDGQLPHESIEADILIGSIIRSYFVDDWDKDPIKKKILKELTKKGCKKEMATQLLEKTVDTFGRLNAEITATPKGKAETLDNAKKQIRNSLLWIAAGTVISIIATASGAFLFFIWYGPVLYGIGKLIKNCIVLWAFSKGNEK